MNITSESLNFFFKENGYFIRARNNVEITLDECGEVFVTLPLDAARSRNIHMDLMADFRDLDEFINAAQIQSFDDLDTIKNSTCWKQYVQGKGYVCCTLDYLNHTDVCFQIVRDTTIVYSLDLHYYDEVDKIFSLPEQFIEYIQQHWRQKGFVEVKIRDAE